MERLTTQTLRRLPSYLHYLKTVDIVATPCISATSLAKALAMGDVQVRKDLAAISVNGNGRPGIGYRVEDLIDDLEEALGWRNDDEAVLVGAGKLGRALMGYSAFGTYGLSIAAAFDSDPDLEDFCVSGVRILSMEKLTDLCSRMKIRIAILTVPAEAAQEVCDQLTACGVKAIWNFAPIHLQVPEGVLVQQEILAASLAVLTDHLKRGEHRHEC